MAICRNPNCAKENPDDLIFCKYCGRRLKEPKDYSKLPLKILIVLTSMIILLISVKAILGLVNRETQNNIQGKGNINNKIVKNNSSQKLTQNMLNYKFVFVRGEGSSKEIYLHDSDGTITKITNSNANNAYPSLSPDARKIVFEREENKTTSIYVINVNGTGEKKLAEGFGPTWTADGSAILFYKKDPESISNVLYKINIDGSNQKKVTQTSDSYYMARYSPEGNKIALTKYSIEGWGIYTVGPDFSGRKTLTISKKKVGNPSWSPDGTKIAFQGEKDGNWEIYTVDLNGNISRITNNQLPDKSPSFTPDGKIIFTREERGGFNLYITDSDGKNEKLILENAAFASVAIK